MFFLYRREFAIPCAHMNASRPCRHKVSGSDSLACVLKAHARKLQALDRVQVADASRVATRPCCQTDLYIAGGMSRCTDTSGEGWRFTFSSRVMFETIACARERELAQVPIPLILAAST